MNYLKKLLAAWMYRRALRNWLANQEEDKWAYRDGELPKHANTPKPKEVL